ncbi:MAG: hypothetical protein ROO76_23825 [Terriglobia bacterium]|nr:hypothetical protein [Terriglobia bacterium]
MRSHRLSSIGRGLMLLPPTVEQLHRLARSFEVLEPAPDRCEACRNLAPSADGACRNVGDVGLSDPAQSETATEPA